MGLGVQSAILTFSRQGLLNIPLLILMNWLTGLYGMIWVQLMVEVIMLPVSLGMYFVTLRRIRKEEAAPTAALNKRPARRRPPKQRVRGNHKWQRQAAQKGSQGKNRPPKKAASLPSGVGFTLLRARRLARQTAAGTVHGAASAVRLRISSTSGVSVKRSVKSTCLP